MSPKGCTEPERCASGAKQPKESFAALQKIPAPQKHPKTIKKALKFAKMSKNLENLNKKTCHLKDVSIRPFFAQTQS